MVVPVRRNFGACLSKYTLLYQHLYNIIHVHCAILTCSITSVHDKSVVKRIQDAMLDSEFSAETIRHKPCY